MTLICGPLLLILIVIIVAFVIGTIQIITLILQKKKRRRKKIILGISAVIILFMLLTAGLLISGPSCHCAHVEFGPVKDTYQNPLMVLTFDGDHRPYIDNDTFAMSLELDSLMKKYSYLIQDMSYQNGSTIITLILDDYERLELKSPERFKWYDMRMIFIIDSDIDEITDQKMFGDSNIYSFQFKLNWYSNLRFRHNSRSSENYNSKFSNDRFEITLETFQYIEGLGYNNILDYHFILYRQLVC